LNYNPKFFVLKRFKAKTTIFYMNT